jgi:hypothetical protein
MIINKSMETIKASELYIDKYYYQVVEEYEPCTPKIIKWNQSNWYRIGECIEFIEWFEPIPLTEEILEKNLGFENWGVIVCNEFEKYERWVLHNVIDGTSNFEVHIIYSNYGKVEQKEICFSIDYDERQRVHKTNFVHNLQNAFNLATGQELEFKQ